MLARMTYTSARDRTFELLELGRGRDRGSIALDWFLATLVICNVIAVVVETVPAIYARHHMNFLYFEIFSVAIFTIEYVARIWCVTSDRFVAELGPIRGRLRTMRNPYLIIDLLAILPFYIMLFTTIDLRALRVFRLLRFFKLTRYSTALTTLFNVIRHESRSLFASFVVMLGLLIASSTLMYHMERTVQPEEFGSIPASMWWGLATLTTVGYGDVTPVTVAGKLFGGLVMIFGLGMAALPIGILATGFSEEIKRRDFVVTWGMVARAPLFSKMDAVEISHIMTMLRAKVAKAGSVIMTPGEPADALYFIDRGEVEIRVSKEEVYVLQDGDFFGERSLLKHGPRTAWATATHDTRLLMLDRDDLLNLLASHPHIAEHFNEAAAERRPDVDFSHVEPVSHRHDRD